MSTARLAKSLESFQGKNVNKEAFPLLELMRCDARPFGRDLVVSDG